MFAAKGLPRTAVPAVAVAFAAVLTGAARWHGERLRPPAVETQLEVPAMPADVARPLAFGFHSMVADLTFLQAIQVLALRKSDVTYERALPQDRLLERLLTYTVHVDPKFAGAYRLAGSALPHETIDRKVTGVLAAHQLLREGVRELPGDWNLFFLLGFLESYYLGDMKEAGAHFGRAATLPGGPAYLGLLATRVEVHGGDLATATRLAETMAAQAQEEDARKQWAERLVLLREERDILALEAAVEQYQERRGRVPPTLQAIVAAGLLRYVPAEPHGATYLVDEDGSVHPTVVRRLRVFGDNAMQSGREVH